MTWDAMAFNSIKYEWACNIKLIKKIKNQKEKHSRLQMKMVTTNIFIWKKKEKKKYTEEIPIGHSSALRQKEFWGREQKRKNEGRIFLFSFIYIIILCCFCNNWTQARSKQQKKVKN